MKKQGNAGTDHNLLLPTEVKNREEGRSCKALTGSQLRPSETHPARVFSHPET